MEQVKIVKITKPAKKIFRRQGANELSAFTARQVTQYSYVVRHGTNASKVNMKMKSRIVCDHWPIVIHYNML